MSKADELFQYIMGEIKDLPSQEAVDCMEELEGLIEVQKTALESDISDGEDETDRE